LIERIQEIDYIFVEKHKSNIFHKEALFSIASRLNNDWVNEVNS
jgi:hypothetical protein